MTTSDSTIPTKTCTGPCGRTLPATEEYFYRNKAYKFGVTAKCRECCRAGSHVWRKEHRDQEIVRHAKYRAEHRETIREKDREYRLKNLERERERSRKYAAAHREERIAYSRTYNASHAEEKRAYSAKYQAEHRDELRSKSRVYDAAHREEKRVRGQVYREAHPELVHEIARRSYEKHIEQRRASARKQNEKRRDKLQRYALEHREERIAYNREYYQSHKEDFKAKSIIYRASPEGQAVRRAANQRRKARKRNSSGSYTAVELEAVIKAHTDSKNQLICALCGKPIKGKYHIDHWIPLRHGGLNTAGNLRILHPKCNLHKSAKMPHELGKLL